MALSNVKAEMARRDLSIEDMATKLGVSWGTVHSWINGKTKVPAVTVKEMAEIFGVTTDYLLGV